MNPAAPVNPWQNSDAYEQYVGRWSRQVAPQFLAWLNIPHRQRWLDVGCGTGALCAAIADHCAPAAVIGVEPADGFLEVAIANLGERALFYSGSAANLPLPSGSVDVVVSGLVLNFVPNIAAALSEMSRVAAHGGTIAAYVWDYADKMELMRYFWDAAIAADLASTAIDEALRFPVCKPQALQTAFQYAGLQKVETAAVTVATDFPSFDAYWQPFLGGQGPAPAYAMSLSEHERQKLRQTLRERLPIKPDGSIHLVARAWLVRGQGVQQSVKPRL